MTNGYDQVVYNEAYDERIGIRIHSQNSFSLEWQALDMQANDFVEDDRNPFPYIMWEPKNSVTWTDSIEKALVLSKEKLR